MSEDMTFHFEDDFQLGIFELMMNDTSFCEKSVGLIQAEYFKNKYYAWFFETIKRLTQEFKAAPSQMQIKNEIKRFPFDKQSVYLQIFKRIVKSESKRDYDYIKRNLEEFIRKCMRFQLNDILVKNQTKPSDFVDGLIKKKIEEMTSVNFSNAHCQSLTHLSTMMEESAYEMGDLIPTYMPNIDRALGGGVPKHTLTLGLSGTNVGKSIWMINWAYHLIKNGYKVFYVCLEGFEKQTMLRLASRAIGASFGDVRWNKLTDIEMLKRKEFVGEYGKNIQILFNSSFGFTIEDLVAIARQKKEEFPFDVMMVDYGQIMKSKEKFSDLRHEQAYIHRGLSSLSGPQECDCAMVTVAQGNRETQEKNSTGRGLIRMSDISECFEIIRCCATVVTLNRSERDVDSHTARALLDKARDGRTNVIDIMKTNFDRTAFYGAADEGLGFMPADEYTLLVKP